MRGGWSKFYEKITEWRWYTDGNTFRLFFHLIVTASRKDKPWKEVIIKRGQRIASYDSLAEELQLTQRQIRTAMEHLKSTGEVTIKATNKYSIVTIINYDIYQAKYAGTEDDNDKQATSETTSRESPKRQASDNQTTTSLDSKDREDRKEGIRERVTCPSPIPPDQVQFSEVVDMYNTSCQNMPKVKALTELRRRAIRARWKNNRADPMAHFRELFTKAGRSSFLNGINDRAWSADFDWLMKEQNAVKVLEGKYDDNARAPAGLKPMQGAVRDKPETNAQRNARVAKELMLKFRAEEGNNGN